MTMQPMGMSMSMTPAKPGMRNGRQSIDPITGLPRMNGTPPVAGTPFAPPAIQSMGLAGNLDAMAQAVKRLF